MIQKDLLHHFFYFATLDLGFIFIMSATSELSISDRTLTTPIGHEHPMIGGAIYTALTPEGSPIYTVVTHGKEFSNEFELDEKGEETSFKKLTEVERHIIAINTHDEFKEVWLLDENRPMVVDRVRFLAGKVEFAHFNGVEPAPIAVFSETDGTRLTEGTILPEGLEVSVPLSIPAGIIEQAIKTLDILVEGVPNSFAFSSTKKLAQLPERLGIFVQSDSRSNS